MAVKKSNKSRISKSNKSGFKFRWWMAAILIFIVVVVGIVIIRSSFAFGSGKIYIEQEGSGPYVEYDFNINGSVNLKESITGAERKNVPFTEARAVGLQMVQEAYTKSGQPEIAALINPSNVPAQVSSQIDAASQAGQGATSGSTTPAATQTTTAPTPQTTASTTTGPTISQSSGTIKAPAYKVASEVEFKLAPSLTNGVSSVVFSVDGEKIVTDNTSPFSFSFDSNKHDNGTHLLQVKMTLTNGSTKTYVFALDIQNKTDRWSRFLERLKGIFG